MKKKISSKIVFLFFPGKFPGIKSFSRQCVEFARQNGYQATIFKRRRYFPNICHGSHNLQAQAERQAVNFCVQGK
jgi:DNA polymerase-1